MKKTVSGILAALSGRLRIIISSIISLTDEDNDTTCLSLLEPNADATLVDCGCADGEFTARAAKRIGTDKVSGIECWEAAAKLAEAKHISVIRADLNHVLEVKDCSFDVLIANNVIEHLSNTDTFLREAYRILKPGGYMVISTTNLSAWHSILFLMLGQQPTVAWVSDKIFVGNIFNPQNNTPDPYNDYPKHRRLFTMPALTGLLKYHGFGVEKKKGAGYYPIGMLARIDKRHANYIVVKARKQNKVRGKFIGHL